MKTLQITGALFLILFLNLSILFAQVDKKYLDIPDKLNVEKRDQSEILKKYHVLLSNAYDLTLALPKNYVTDGSKDYTAFIQGAINRHRNVVFPDFPILVNEKGLSLRSNSSVLFKSRSIIKMIGSSMASYSILSIKNVKNLELFFPNLMGDRLIHKGSLGEGGMGIRIYSSQDVNIYNPVIRNCWGDGIYIANGHKVMTKRIGLLNAQIDFCRRNGITITGGSTINISSPLITNTIGTSPMSGIDIEPNNNTSLNNISITNYTSFNNGMSALQIGLSRLPGSEERNVNISIDDLTIYGGESGIRLGGYYSRYDIAKKINGSIQITNVKIKGVSKNFITLAQNYHFGPTIVLRNLEYIDGRPAYNEFLEKVLLRKNIFVYE